MPSSVFITEQGARLDPNHLSKYVFYRLLARAGLRQVRFHDLRHTFASLLLQNGESPAAGRAGDVAQQVMSGQDRLTAEFLYANLHHVRPLSYSNISRCRAQ